MVQKYATLVVKDYVATLQPKLLSRKYHHDGTEIIVDEDGEDMNFGKPIDKIQDLLLLLIYFQKLGQATNSRC